MRPGTPGFNKNRLRAAREARGISGAALAELVGVSRSAISQYERGEQTPSPQVLHRLASGLNLPARHFLGEVCDVDGAIFYRSFSAALKGARQRAERRLEWLQEIVAVIAGCVELPSPNVPDVVGNRDLLSLSGEEIDDVARQVRRAWNLGDGPISHLVRLLERNGFIVARHFLDSDRLDAFSNWKGDSQVPFVVLGKDKNCAVRSRFDAAHELGHMVLHRGFTASDLKRRDIFQKIESQANRFAGAFLLPDSTFLSEVCSFSLEQFVAMKERWGASVGLMIKRCSDLVAGDEEVFRRLYVQLGKRGWRKREPLDDELIPEQPQLLVKSFDALVRSQLNARDLLLAQLPWHPQEIEDLAGLPSGTLSTGGDIPSLETPNILRFPGV